MPPLLTGATARVFLSFELHRRISLETGESEGICYFRRPLSHSYTPHPRITGHKEYRGKLV